MGRTLFEKARSWLLPVVLILFILEVLTIPLVFGVTYAGRSELPEHILSYKAGKLTWESINGIDENGAAKLNLFDSVYENVKSVDGDKIIAPGTHGGDIVRLKNSGKKPIGYTVVLYRVYADKEIPIDIELGGHGFTETKDYILPDGVSDEQIVSAVTGSINGNEIIDFDVSWSWKYGEGTGTDNDVIDTLLADEDAEESVTVGLYILVQDKNYGSFDPDHDDGFIVPDPPVTGDNSYVGIYVAIIIISLCILIFLLVEKKKRGNKEKTCI